jgi:hypothetical protein
MSNPTLFESSCTHEVDAPIEQVDIADWLAHLGNAEFRRCCVPDHVACGFTHTDNGRPMSVNVETIGPSLLIQQYVAEVFEPLRCRMVSVSDVFSLSGDRTESLVIWTLTVEPDDDQGCRLVNTVTSTATPRFLDFLQQHGQTIEQAAAARREAAADHNRRETPGYAASIARAAKARQDVLA